MRTKSVFASAAFALCLASSAFAGNYQVTGPVLELTDTKIVVQKGDEKWEIARTADTKVKGDLKVGSKVTIQYTMTATNVEVKDAPAKEGKDAKPATPKKP